MANKLAAGNSNINELIGIIRDKQVMLDSDLAHLYEVETGNLNKAATRNIERFPESFRFQLTQEEWDTLLFQTGRAKQEGRGGRRTAPFAYTEQGVLIIDKSACYHIGASIKDAGKRTFAISLLEDGAITQTLLSRVERSEVK